MYARRSFPCLYATMTHKTQQSYTAIFHWISAKATQLYPRDQQPIKWVKTLTDFESGLLPSLQAHNFGPLPIEVTGCHFHHTQCIWRQVQRVGLAAIYRTTPAVKNFIRCLFAISFLPVHEVNLGYEEFKYSEHSAHLRIQYPALEGLCNYYENTWLRGNYNLEIWNVYSADSLRTTNNIEGYHHHANNYFGEKKTCGSFWPGYTIDKNRKDL